MHNRLPLTHSKDFEKEQEIKSQKSFSKHFSVQSDADNEQKTIATKRSHCFYRSNKFIPENSVVYTNKKRKYSYIIDEKGKIERVQIRKNAIKSQNTKNKEGDQKVTGHNGEVYCVRHNPHQEVRKGLPFFKARPNRIYIIIEDKNGEREVNIQRLCSAIRSIKSVNKKKKLDPPLEAHLYALIAPDVTEKSERRKNKKPKLAPLVAPLQIISSQNNDQEQEEVKQYAEKVQENFLLTPPFPLEEEVLPLPLGLSESLFNQGDLKESNSILESDTLISNSHEMCSSPFVLEEINVFEADEKKPTSPVKKTYSKDTTFHYTGKYTGHDYKHYCVKAHPEQPIPDGLPILNKGIGVYVEIPQDEGEQIDPVRVQSISNARRLDRNKKLSSPLPKHLWERFWRPIPSVSSVSLDAVISQNNVKKRKRKKLTTQKRTIDSSILKTAPCLSFSLDPSSELASLELKLDQDQSFQEDSLNLDAQPSVLLSPVLFSDVEAASSPSPSFSLEPKYDPVQDQFLEEDSLNLDKPPHVLLSPAPFSDVEAVFSLLSFHQENPLNLDESEPFVSSSPVPFSDVEMASPVSLEFPFEEAPEGFNFDFSPLLQNQLLEESPAEQKVPSSELSFSDNEMDLPFAEELKNELHSVSTKKTGSGYSPLFFKKSSLPSVQDESPMLDGEVATNSIF